MFWECSTRSFVCDHQRLRGRDTLEPVVKIGLQAQRYTGEGQHKKTPTQHCKPVKKIGLLCSSVNMTVSLEVTTHDSLGFSCGLGGTLRGPVWIQGSPRCILTQGTILGCRLFKALGQFLKEMEERPDGST